MNPELIKDSNFDYYVNRLIKEDKVNEHPRFSKFLDMAKTLSQESNFEKYKIGAVIAIKGKAIARGFNSYKTHPQQKLYNRERANFSEESKPFIHAEMAALQRLRGENLKNAELYVFRTGRDGTNRMCRPCAGCMAAIKDKGISVIHYTTEQGIATEYLDRNLPIKVKKSRSLI